MCGPATQEDWRRLASERPDEVSVVAFYSPKGDTALLVNDRRDRSMAILYDAGPYNPGWLQYVPGEEVAEQSDLTEDEVRSILVGRLAGGFITDLPIPEEEDEQDEDGDWFTTSDEEDLEPVSAV